MQWASENKVVITKNALNYHIYLVPLNYFRSNDLKTSTTNLGELKMLESETNCMAVLCAETSSRVNYNEGNEIRFSYLCTKSKILSLKKDFRAWNSCAGVVRHLISGRLNNRWKVGGLDMDFSSVSEKVNNYEKTYFLAAPKTVFAISQLISAENLLSNIVIRKPNYSKKQH